MSHVTTISVKIRDIKALRATVAELGGVFVENQKTYAWWGESVGDTPLPEGMTKDMLGKCDHAIKVPGVNYEIGVVKMKEGHYTLAYDSYNYSARPNGIRADGGKLLSKFGDGLKRLVQTYATCKLELEARAKGWMTSRSMLQNGNIRVTVTGV